MRVPVGDSRVQRALARGETVRVKHLSLWIDEAGQMHWHCAQCVASLEFPFEHIQSRIVDAQAFLDKHIHKENA